MTRVPNHDRAEYGAAKGVVAGQSEAGRLPQIPALTGLRFMAATFILIEHAAAWLAQFTNSNVEKYFEVFGIFGMPLFFVLSGFVIHYNYRRLFLSRSITRAACEFAAARFARLFPLYLCLLLVAVTADKLLANTHGDLTLIAKIMAFYITLTQTWWYVVYDNKVLINWIFGLSWSISTEMFFYAAFVALVFLILPIRRGRTAALVAIGYGVGILYFLCIVPSYFGSIFAVARHYIPYYIGPADFPNSFYRWLFYLSPYVRIFEFLMGCLTAHVFMLTRHRPVGLWERRLADVALVFAAIFLVAAGMFHIDVIHLGKVNEYVRFLALNFLFAPALAFIMFHVARYDSRFARMLSGPTIIVLGDLSYSVYLLHNWTFQIFERQAPPFNFFWGVDTVLRVVCAIGLTLVTAYATYHLIEVPSRAWLRRKLGALIDAALGRWEKTSEADGTAAQKIKPSRWKWQYGSRQTGAQP